MRPKWTSSHPSIVSVDEFGVITAKKAGSATVTASVDGVRATCKITVKP
ncbi:MAG: Ig-like domain-containing protein [Eubacterium sp.]